MSFDDYRELLEWTGRACRRSKSGKPIGGKLKGRQPAVLAKLRIDANAWMQTMVTAGLSTGHTFGTASAMDAEAERRGKRWLKGKRAATQLFGKAA